MNLESFKEYLLEKLKSNKIDVNLNNNEIQKLYEYMKYILEKNQYINLTAITDEKDFILKHIVDSLYIQKYIDIFKEEYIFDIEEYLDSSNLSKIEKENIKNQKLRYIDIGTGGGFPLSIVSVLNEDIESYGLDSINKKLKVINDSNINVKTIHARAELLAHDVKYREQFYICTSRAVANLNSIIQLMAGFVSPSGYLICMKGDLEEYDEKIFEKFSLELEHIEEYTIDNLTRTIYIFKKIDELNPKLPLKNTKKY